MSKSAIQNLMERVDHELIIPIDMVEVRVIEFIEAYVLYHQGKSLTDCVCDMCIIYGLKFRYTFDDYGAVKSIMFMKR